MSSLSRVFWWIAAGWLHRFGSLRVSRRGFWAADHPAASANPNVTNSSHEKAEEWPPCLAHVLDIAAELRRLGGPLSGRDVADLETELLRVDQIGIEIRAW